MAEKSVQEVAPARGWKRVQKLVSGSAAVALVSGMIVVAGIGVQSALAQGPAPRASISVPPTFIAGENLTVDLGFQSAEGATADEYNLAAGLIVSENVDLVSAGGMLGAGVEYPAGKAIPGRYGPIPNAAYCTDLGLVQAEAPEDTTLCAPAPGTKYIVFENISDLPVGANTSHPVTLRPHAGTVFEPGDSIELRMVAFTSDDPSMLPIFPGSSGRALPGSTHTSSPGFAARDVGVNALRVTKSDAEPENELLRGVHDHTTTYTLRVHHTGEGDLSTVKVVDFLPAGLEYLGKGGIDHTANANGNRADESEAAGLVEYQDAPRLDGTPAPDGGTGRWGASGDEESVVTVRADQALIDQYPDLGLVDGAIYTMVTWNLGALLASDAEDLEPGVQQDVTDPEHPVDGAAGYFEIRYRVAVPLFENTLDFDGANGQPDGESLEQIANLDNNRGPSTRHGVPHDGEPNRNPAAQVMTNRAAAQGEYQGERVVAGAQHSIQAVDVRVLKGVNGVFEGVDEFTQEGNADYELRISTSEYVSASLDFQGVTQRLADDAGDGLCYALSNPDTVITAATRDGVSNPGGRVGDGAAPFFALGNPADGPTVTWTDDVAAWNDYLEQHGVSAECQWGTPEAVAKADGAPLEGATLYAIAFDPATGHFYMRMDLDPQDALNTVNAVSNPGPGYHSIKYRAVQNRAYYDANNSGATSSGDTVTNQAEFQGVTKEREELEDLTSASGAEAFGDYDAWNDSHATLQASLSSFDKRVLQRGGLPASGDVTEAAADEWVKSADEPFSIGDEVWYRIRIEPPAGADVRNPELRDFLPAGASFPSTPVLGTDYVVSPVDPDDATSGVGTCEPTDLDSWRDAFVSTPQVAGNRSVFFELGGDCGLGGDRFLPRNVPIDIFLKATVTDVSAFGEVDFPENQAKYRQNNVEQDIHFDRSDAKIEADQMVRLTKGIESNGYRDPATGEYAYPEAGDPGSMAVNGFETNVDGQLAVQGDEVTFRLDVRAPRNTTNGYLLIDALPEGIAKGDVKPGAFTARLIDATPDLTPGNEGRLIVSESPITSGFTATVLDPSDPADQAAYDALGLKAEFEGRTVIVWEVDPSVSVPGSTPAGVPDEDDPEHVRGLTLGYTLVVPAGGSGQGEAAQLSQQYVNDASIAEFNFENNTGANSRVIIDGTDSVVEPREPGNGEFVFDDAANDASDPSGLQLPPAVAAKVLVSTEVGSTTAGSGRDQATGLTDLGDAQNNGESVVQGEYADFRYSVVIPANTTVSGAELFDDGLFRYGANGSTPYEFVSASSKALRPNGDEIAGFDWTDFDLDSATGRLTFPESYTNGTAEAQTFAVDIRVWVEDQNGDSALGLTDGTRLTNTARFEWADPNRPDGAAKLQSDASASVLYREPAPQIAKSATPTAGVKIGDPIAYTLTVGNPASLPKSYENVVTDTMPAGLKLRVDAGDPLASFTVGGTPVAYEVRDLPHDAPFAPNTVVVEPGVVDGTGGTITWHPDAFAQLGSLPTATAPGTLALGYVAEIDPTAGGGQQYTNEADVTGHTLPSTVGGESTTTPTERRGNRGDDAEATISATTAEIGKLVRIKPTPPNDPAYTAAVSAPVGQTVQYEVKATLHQNINYYDVSVRDTLPTGLQLQTGTVKVYMQTGSGPREDVTADWTRSGSDPNHVWTYTKAGANGDLLRDDEERVLTFAYDALVSNGVPAGSPASVLNNSANLAWAATPTGAPSTPLPPASATVNMLHPNVAALKQVKRSDQAVGSYAASASGEVDQTFNYRIRVLNSGNTAAYNVKATDCVPAGIDPATIANISHGGQLGAATGPCPGGVISWTLDGPVGTGTGNAVFLSYDAKFSNSESLTVAGKVNTARVTGFDSFASGERRSYGPTANSSATTTPRFPNVTLAKSVTNPAGTQGGTGYGIAYVGESFNWTLRVSNATGGTVGVANQISVVDTLPANWQYVGNAQISLNNGTSWAPLTTAPVEDTVGGKVRLTWGETAIRTAGATPLAAGGSFLIRFDARPTADALTDPGTGGVRGGVRVKPHTNTLSATATDLQNHSRNAAGSYVGPNSTADAFINQADLQLTKTTVPTVPVKAGSSNVDAWRLVVKNNGPDTAVGPITVKDVTGPLPAGITVASASGTGWTCTVGTRAGDGATPIDCARDAANESLANGAEFAPIVVKVNVASSQPSTTVNNAAIVVPGKTYDPNYVANPEDPGYTTQNNRSTAPLETTTEADLRLVKTVSAPAEIPEDGVVVGSQLQWRLSVTNLGPSDSASVEGDRITITDTVPAGIENIADPSNASWTATVADGDGAAKSFPARAGDVITWTYTGDSLGFNVTSEVTLTGTIMTSHVGDVVNAARVHPGATDDPNYGTPNENNRGEVTTPTDDSTVLEITKTRVVADADAADGWRQADPANPDDAFVAGDPVYYRITVENRGAADLRNVQVVDEAPAGLTFKAGITNPVNLSGTWSASAVPSSNWHRFALGGGSIPVTQSRAFVVVYDTATTITDDVVNWAEATADNAPSDRDDDSTGATRIVDLGIEKTHVGTGPFTPGTEVSYTLVVTNHGASATNGGIEIEDLLPPGMSYVPGSASVTVPAGTTAPAAPEPALGGPGSRTLGWNLLATTDVFDVGQTITVSFDAKIDPALRGGVALENTATVEGPDPEPDPDTEHPNRDTDTITTTGATATMAIAKQVETTAGNWDETAQKTAGTVMRWRVTVTNNGPSAAPVSFSDALPTGLSFAGPLVGAGWDCPAPGGVPTGSCTYTANGGLHPVGAANATTIVIEAYIDPALRPTDPPAVPALTNTGTISWTDEVTAGTQTASDPASVTIVNDADLGIVKDVIAEAGGAVVDDPAPSTAGESVWYRLQATNHGPSDASGPITVTDTLPLGVTVPVGTSPGGAGGWTMVGGPVTPGERQVVTFVLEGGQTAKTVASPERGTAPVIEFEAHIAPTAAHGAVLTNDSHIASPTNDSNPANDDDDAQILVERSADLEIAKSHPVADERDRVFVGDPLEFTIAVKNHGPSVSSGFEITDTVPVGFTVTSGTGPVLDEGGDPTGWEIRSIEPNPDGTTTIVAGYTGTLGVEAGVDDEAPPLIIETMVEEDAFSETPRVNHVAITDANEPDPVEPNDEADDPIKVRPVVTLVIEKTAVGEFKVGKTGTYRITVENLGPHPDHGPITVTDQLPTGLTYVSSPNLPEGATVTHDKGLVTWTLTEPLGVDELVELTLVVNVHQAAYDQPNHTVTNEASVDTESQKSDDPRWHPTDSASVKVKPADPLVVTGGELAGGMLAALALLLLLGGGVYLAGRRRQRAQHG